MKKILINKLTMKNIIRKFQTIVFVLVAIIIALHSIQINFL